MGQAKLQEERISIRISKDLYHAIEEEIRNGSFNSVDDYVNYVIRTQIGKKHPPQDDLSDEDSEVVTSRLKALGYI
jgi:Arc/MetJ-type ribon-helix-helix transcriptional regulator